MCGWCCGCVWMMADGGDQECGDEDDNLDDDADDGGDGDDDEDDDDDENDDDVCGSLNPTTARS